MARKTVKRTKRGVQNRTASTRVKWERAFLAALRNFGVVRAACEASKVPRSTATTHRKNNARFAALWDEALEDFADSLESEALRRARDGTVKGIYYKGELTNTEHEYSDQLMAIMLKAKRPDQYGDKLTVKIEPEWAAKLKEHGLTPLEAMARLINALDKVEADA